MVEFERGKIQMLRDKVLRNKVWDNDLNPNELWVKCLCLLK